MHKRMPPELKDFVDRRLRDVADDRRLVDLKALVGELAEHPHASGISQQRLEMLVADQANRLDLAIVFGEKPQPPG